MFIDHNGSYPSQKLIQGHSLYSRQCCGSPDTNAHFIHCSANKPSQVLQLCQKCINRTKSVCHKFQPPSMYLLRRQPSIAKILSFDTINLIVNTCIRYQLTLATFFFFFLEEDNFNLIFTVSNILKEELGSKIEEEFSGQICRQFLETLRMRLGPSHFAKSLNNSSTNSRVMQR